MVDRRPSATSGTPSFARWIVGDRGDGPACTGAATTWRRPLLPRCRGLLRARTCCRRGACRAGRRRRPPSPSSVRTTSGVPSRGPSSATTRTPSPPSCARTASARATASPPGCRTPPRCWSRCSAPHWSARVFTSTSPDFGVAGVLDRFGQVEPTVLVGTDGYVYAGKQQPRLDRLAEVVDGLPSVRVTVVVGELEAAPDLDGTAGRRSRGRRAAPRCATAPREPVRLPLSSAGVHPLQLRDHGSAEVHRAQRRRPGPEARRRAAPALRHPARRRRLLLHDLRLDDVELAGLGAGLRRIAGALRRVAVPPCPGSAVGPRRRARHHLLRHVGQVHRRLAQGGRPPARDPPARHAAHHRVHRLSLGGTRASSTSTSRSRPTCTWRRSPAAPTSAAASSPATPPDRSTAARSRDPCSAWPSTSTTRRARRCADSRAAHGELVCTAPFPSMPVGFWNDPDGERYHAAYFDRFPGIWAHGDFASWTPHDGLVIHGRSDATLNAGGVRIGTAEIYRQVERLPEVVEALAVGQEWDDDTRIVLFVRLADGRELDDAARRPPSSGRCARTARHVTCRPRSSRSTTFRGPAATSSPSWPSPT